MLRAMCTTRVRVWSLNAAGCSAVGPWGGGGGASRRGALCKMKVCRAMCEM